MLLFLLGCAAALATFLGGYFALRYKDQLHLILGFSAGAVLGVTFFDLLPESLQLTASVYPITSVTLLFATGFWLFLLLHQVILLHPHADDDCRNGHHQGNIGAASLALHSLLDGLAIGLAFRVSPSLGSIVAFAVLAHDFSDGINTVSLILKDQGNRLQALRWLTVDSLAPLLGIILSQFFLLSSPTLGLILALFAGFFLYIGASDLVPESHHRHPKAITSFMTVLGALLIYLVVSLS